MLQICGGNEKEKKLSGGTEKRKADDGEPNKDLKKVSAKNRLNQQQKKAQEIFSFWVIIIHLFIIFNVFRARGACLRYWDDNDAADGNLAVCSFVLMQLSSDGNS